MASKFMIGWRQVVACLVLQAVGGAMLAPAYSVLAVQFGHDFHPSRMVLMLAMTVMAGGSAVLSPPLGTLMDRVSIRRLMFIGTALLVGGYVALSFVTSFVQVLLIYTLFMAPANVLAGTMAASVLVSRWFSKRRGAAIGMSVLGVALGSLIFPPVIQWLVGTYEWRIALRLLALIIALVVFPMVAMVIDRPADRRLHPDGAAHDPEPTHGYDPARRIATSTILSDPTFWIATAIFAIVLSGMKGMVTNLVQLGVDQGITPASAALLLSIYAACGMVAKFSFALVSDRMNLRYLLFISLIGFGTGMACLTRAHDGYALIATGVGLVGLFGGLMVPLQGLLVARIYGVEIVGRVAGLLTMFVLGALLSTPPLFGLIFDLTGSYNAIFLIFSALAAGALLLVPYMRLQAKAGEADIAEAVILADR